MASAEGIKAGRAYVSVGTDDGDLQKGLRAAEKKVQAFGSAVQGVGARLAGLGVAIVTPFLAAAKTFADTGSDLNDMAARTGLSVEALSQLGFAAKQSGTDLETVEGAVRKMQKALLAGSEENLQAAGTFASLGLSVRGLARLTPERQFEILAKRIAAIPDPTARAGAAMQVFGKSGTALLPLIGDFDALVKQAKDLGLVMSTEDAKAADAFGDALDAVTAQLKQSAVLVGSALAPMLTLLAENLTHVVKSALDWISANRPLVTTIFQAGVAVTALGAATLAAGVAISALGSILGGIAAGIAVLTSPVALVTAGLAAGAVAFLKYTTAGGHALAFLSQGFGTLRADATAALEGIGNALSAGDIQLAAKVLWAALRVEWLKGVNFLKGVWAEWSTGAVEAFRAVNFSLASLTVDLWADVQTAWVNGSANVQEVWATAVGAVMDAWDGFAGFVQGVWADAIGSVLKGFNSFFGAVSFHVAQIKALFSGLAFDAEAFGKQMAGIEEDVRARNQAVDDSLGALGQGRADAQAKRQADARAASEARAGDRTRGLAGVESDRAAAQANLEGDEKSEADARRKRAADGLASGASDLASAQEELKGLLAEANRPRAAPAGAAGKGGPEAPDLSPEGLDHALEQSKAKVDVAGSFNASAFRGLGVGSSAAEQLNEQKKTNEKLDKLNDKARQGRLVFGA